MGYLAFVQTVKSTANQDLTALGGLDWRHWNGFSQNSSTRKTSGAGISDLSDIGSITTDQTASARTVTASDPSLSTVNSGVFFGANGTTGWGERFTVDIGTTRKKCYIMAGQFSSAVKVDISLSDSSASAISYTYAQSSIYSTDGLLIEFDLEANSAGQTATVDITCSTNIDFGRIGVQAITLATASAGAYTLDCNAGAFALAGQQATLSRNRTLDANAGAFALAGQTAEILKSKSIIAVEGAFTLAGQQAELVYTPLAAAYTLDANAGSFALTGQQADLLKSYVIDAQAGAFALTGQDAVLAKGRVLDANAGSFSLAGQDATLLKSYVLDCEAGSFILTGRSATIEYSGAPPVSETPLHPISVLVVSQLGAK